MTTDPQDTLMHELHPSEPKPGLRERCKAIATKLQRDAMLRQGSPVETLMEFVIAERGRAADDALTDTLPVCLYFATDADREEFMAAMREWKPGMIVRKVP